MGILYETLVRLSPVHDAEILEGYRRYETALSTILTPEQMAAYAAYIDTTDEIRIFEEMTPAELASLPPGAPRRGRRSDRRSRPLDGEPACGRPAQPARRA